MKTKKVSEEREMFVYVCKDLERLTKRKVYSDQGWFRKISEDREMFAKTENSLQRPIKVYLHRERSTTYTSLILNDLY